MKTIILHSASTGEVKLRVPQCVARPDGSIWHKNTMPIVVTAGLPDSDELKAKYQNLLNNKRSNEIPLEHIARIGAIRDIIVEWDDDYQKRPEHPVQKEKQRLMREQEENRIEIHLSSRGWGDFSSVKWAGDRRKTTADILTECRRKLETQNDVDHPNQTDDELIQKITEAKQKSITRDQKQASTAAELASTEIPEEAIRAYKSCRGNPENFPDDIDHPLYWLVKRYASAIEHQNKGGSATIQKFTEELRESTREESAQYTGEA